MEKKKLPDRAWLAVIFLAAAGVILVITGSLGGGENPETVYEDVGFYTEYLEGRIAGLCNSVEGVENASVFLTLDCSSEYVYNREGSSDYLILSGSGGEEAVLLQEIYPKVRGIAVVCAGGETPRIRETLTELLAAALDLPAHRIRIAGS